MRWIEDTFRFVSLFDGWSDTMSGLYREYPRGFVYLNDIDLLLITSGEKITNIPRMTMPVPDAYKELKESITGLVKKQNVSKEDFIEGSKKAFEFLSEGKYKEEFKEVPQFVLDWFETMLDIFDIEGISIDRLINNIYLVADDIYDN